MRMVQYSTIVQSKRYNYFSTYMEICNKLVSEFELSPTEYKMMTEILSGRTNEEIAYRNFVSVPTVKTHLQHIFKKTGTKNRVDFIGKFFTSPQNIDL